VAEGQDILSTGMQIFYSDCGTTAITNLSGFSQQHCTARMQLLHSNSYSMYTWYDSHIWWGTQGLSALITVLSIIWHACMWCG